MKKSFLTTLAVSGITLFATAQITLDHTLDGRIAEIIELSGSGPKIITYNNTTLRLYNMDYTLWKTIQMPQLAGYEVTFWGAKSALVSEDLFDNDPSNIEFIVNYYPANSQNLPDKTVVLRDDGSVVDEFEGSIRWDEIPNIFQGSDGKIKLPVSVGDSNNEEIRIYSLPGSYPCQPDVCQQSDNSSLRPASFERHGGILGDPVPNPSTSTVVVSYTLPSTIRTAFLQVSAINGKLMERRFIESQNGTIILDVSQYTTGNYLYRITSPEGTSIAKKFQIIR